MPDSVSARFRRHPSLEVTLSQARSREIKRMRRRPRSDLPRPAEGAALRQS